MFDQSRSEKDVMSFGGRVFVVRCVGVFSSCQSMSEKYKRQIVKNKFVLEPRNTKRDALMGYSSKN